MICFLISVTFCVETKQVSQLKKSPLTTHETSAATRTFAHNYRFFSTGGLRVFSCELTCEVSPLKTEIKTCLAVGQLFQNLVIAQYFEFYLKLIKTAILQAIVK